MQGKRQFALPLSLDVRRQRKMHNYTFRVASDIVRDGLGVELLTESGEVVAEVFRCGSDRTITLSTFTNDIPVAAIETLLSNAMVRLDPFSNGSPIGEAVVAAPKPVCSAAELDR